MPNFFASTSAQTPLTEDEMVSLEGLLLGDPPWEAFRKAAFSLMWRGGLLGLLMTLVFWIGVIASAFTRLLPAFLICMGLVPLINSLAEPLQHLQEERERGVRLSEYLSRLNVTDHAFTPALLALTHQHPGNPHAKLHLARLLPLLNALPDEAVPLFLKPQRTALHRLLGKDERHIHISVIHALTKVGDLSSLPVLTSLRDWYGGREIEIRDLCEGCERAIAERERAKQWAKILLRPATENMNEADLVRAISTSQEQESDAAELLRSRE